MRHHRYSVSTCLLLLLIFCFNITASAQGSKKVVVLPFRGMPEVSDKLKEELRRFQTLAICSDEEVIGVILAQRIANDQIHDPANLRLIGTELSAAFVIHGQVIKQHQTTSLECTVFAVKSARVINKFCLSDLSSKQDLLAQRLAFMIIGSKYYSPALRQYALIDQTDQTPPHPDPTFDNIELEQADIQSITFVDGKSYPVNLSAFFWLPGGQDLLGVISEGRKYAIARINVETGKYNLLTETLSSSEIISLSLSPDLKTIAYSTKKQIFLVDIAGQSVQKITAGVYPSWSSDGQKLAYNKSARLNEIFIFNLENKRNSRLFSGKIPAWLPGDKEIITDFTISANPKIVIVNELFVTKKVAAPAAWNYIPLLSSHTFAGSKVAISPNYRFYLSRLDETLVINDIASGKTAEILAGGQTITVGSSNIAWEKDGRRIAYCDASTNDLVIATLGFKQYRIAKVNAGTELGLVAGRYVSLIEVREKLSPLTGRIAQFKEKNIANLKIGKAFAHVAYLVSPKGEFDKLDQSVLVKFRSKNKQGTVAKEATITATYDSYQDLLASENSAAQKIFEKSGQLYDTGELAAAQQGYRLLVNTFPLTSQAAKSERMLQLLQN